MRESHSCWEEHDHRPRSRLTRAGIIFDPTLKISDPLRNRESKTEHDDYQGPKFLHQKILGIESEQFTDAKNSDQELADDYPLDAAYDSQPHAGQYFRESAQKQHLGVELPARCTETARHFHQRSVRLLHADLGVEDNHE